MVVTVLGNDERFIMELEFVQSLANPAYLSCTLHSQRLAAHR